MLAFFVPRTTQSRRQNIKQADEGECKPEPEHLGSGLMFSLMDLVKCDKVVNLTVPLIPHTRRRIMKCALSSSENFCK
jgi:hypothetical protein